MVCTVFDLQDPTKTMKSWVLLLTNNFPPSFLKASSYEGTKGADVIKEIITILSFPPTVNELSH